MIRHPLLLAAGLAVSITLFGSRHKSILTATAASLSDASSQGIYTDAQIVALLDEANQADSAAAHFAYEKTTNPRVKAFARREMNDHRDLRRRTQLLARRLDVIVPQMVSDDPVKDMADQEMNALRTAPAGAAFDQAYLAQEMLMHRNVIELVSQLRASTDNRAIQSMISDQSGVLNAHLRHAEQLRKKAT